MKKSAFTLLEVVVSLSLFALFLLLLFTVSNLLLHRWSLLKEQQRNCSDTSLLFHRMIRELHSCVPVPNSFFVDLPTVDPRCKKNLFFLTTAASLKTYGEISAIGYFFVEEKKNSPRYNCYRYELSPQETSEALHAHTVESLFARASSSTSKSCHCVATHIIDWNVRPAWILHEKISATPPQLVGKENTPNLVEIRLAMSTSNSPPFGKASAHTTAFSTVVPLLPSL
jgi:hypothetical protein